MVLLSNRLGAFSRHSGFGIGCAAFSTVQSPGVSSVFNAHLPNIANLEVKFPARSYPMARRIQRDVHLHIGPTNSGKSYTALLAFKQAQSGYYAGPLRMLAREIYDRMALDQIPCSLITGDEVLEKPGAQLRSCTIEMLNLNIDMDVAVIDEIQMLHDPDRGSVWTQALLGVRARQLHLCGDPNSENLVRALMEETGDKLTVHRYERLSPLEVIKTPLILNKKSDKGGKLKGKCDRRNMKQFYQSLQPGDCVVAFSKRVVQGVRDKIVDAKGRTDCCAIIYGSLPPEIRAEQAKLYNSPASGVDYLVASDAIGMGLNLAIKRIVFVTLDKFDGRQMRKLDVSEIKQIAGRAGRFRLQDGQEGESGKVVCINRKDSELVQNALNVKTPELRSAYVVASKQTLKSTMLEKNGQIRFSEAIKMLQNNVETGANYKISNAKDNAHAATMFDDVKDLTFEERLKLMDAPVSDDPILIATFKQMCKEIAKSNVTNVLKLFSKLLQVLSKPATSTQSLETVHKVLSLYLWLSYRFPCNFTDRESAMDLRRLCEHRFNTLLRSKRSLASPGGSQITAFAKMARKPRRLRFR